MMESKDGHNNEMDDFESAGRMEDDAALVACKSGDCKGLGVLVRRYERELMGHALALTGNRENALDVVQETSVRAFRSLGRFETGRKFYPYLYGIMRNLCGHRLCPAELWHDARFCYNGGRRNQNAARDTADSERPQVRKDRRLVWVKAYLGS